MLLIKKLGFGSVWFVIFFTIGILGTTAAIATTQKPEKGSSYSRGYTAGKQFGMPLTVAAAVLAIAGSATGVLPGTGGAKR